MPAPEQPTTDHAATRDDARKDGALLVTAIVLAVVAAVLTVVAIMSAAGALGGSPVATRPATSSAGTASASVGSASDGQAASSVDSGTAFSPEEFYAPVIEAYGELTHTSQKLSNNGDRFINPAMRSAPYKYEEGTPSYAFVDLAGDGRPELIIAMKFVMAGQNRGMSGCDATYRVYDIYGYEPGGDEPVRLTLSGGSHADGDELTTFTLFEDGHFGNELLCTLREGNYVEVKNCFDLRFVDLEYFTLPKESTQLKLRERFSDSKWSDTATYISEENGYAEEKISSQRANEMYNSSKPLENIDWKPLG